MQAPLFTQATADPSAGEQPEEKSTVEDLETALTKLFVSDLPASATTDELRTHFAKFGELDEVVVKHGTGAHGAHFGFVWTDSVTARKIMSQPHSVCGVDIPAPVLAKRQQRFTKGMKTTVDPRCTPDKIFVGGLSNETKLEDYRVAFAPHSHPSVPLRPPFLFPSP